LATTLITCTALQANDQETKQQPQGVGGPQSSERSSGKSDRAQQGNEQQKFVQKALKGGQMEVKMGQLAQQKGQNQEVKNLGQALVRDHTQANQQLQQIAQSLNISATDPQGRKEAHEGHDADKHQKHQQAMTKLEGQSGAEFDKEFVRMAIKHHKKSVAEFERCQQEVKDAQLKSFIQQTLPKLRQHLQMAQTAARSVGVDESTIAADDADTDTATGAPAAGQIGTQPRNTESKPRSSLDQDGTSISGDAQVGDRQFSTDVNADVDTADDSAAVDIDADADTDGKVFEKGDGKVLGLPTSKTDGTYLGIIPKPDGKKDSDADASIEADIDTDTSTGAAARNESGTSSDKDVDVDVDVDKE
jgi:putative membrane protein